MFPLKRHFALKNFVNLMTAVQKKHKSDLRNHVVILGPSRCCLSLLKLHHKLHQKSVDIPS